MNLSERLNRLELKFNPKASREILPNKGYFKDVPLARGYKHERSKRPASFCRVVVVNAPDNVLHLSFTFGWFRRTVHREGIRHVLIPVPDGEFHEHRSINAHEDLEIFEREMRDVIRVLHRHEFESILELYDFMSVWTERLGHLPTLQTLRLDRLHRAFAFIKKEEKPTVVSTAKPPRYRMGRPLVSHGMVRYRGR